MLEIYQGSLEVNSIVNRWYNELKTKNYGAIIHFIGVVREENKISGLSFDIYEPLLKKWFNSWLELANQKNALIYMAHSVGDVLVHESSYIALVASPKRKIALSLINEFVEDFKANAPIWKYDLVDGKRVFAKDRSQKLDGAGILLN